MTDVYVGSDGSAPSDGELILEVRGGSLEAYGALYARHSGAARVLARQYVRCDGDADDVVSDAFQRVLGVLQQGNGPDTHFRAYLFTVVRRLAADLAHGARRTRPTDDDGTFEDAMGPSSSPEDPALAGFESSVVARAYDGLPERWQAVLWYTEVEELSPAQVAPILGLTPNGVSALAYRAREGLRVGYLQQHLCGDPADSCRAVNPLLGGYVRGGLARREVAKVDRHLEVCQDCRTLVLELGDVAHGMRAVVAPLVVGLAGTAILGALPLGTATIGAGAAAGAGVGAGAAGAGATAGTVGTGATAGSAGATAAGASTVAGTSTAAGAGGAAAAGGAGAAGAGAAGAVAAGAATAGTATGAAAGSAVGGAAAAAGATAGAGAAGAAGVSGAAVVASTGAVAAATVGVVSVLGVISDADAAQEVPDGAPVAVEASPWPSADAEGRADPSPGPDPQEDPTDPANLPWLADDPGIPVPAAVSVHVPDADAELRPRATDYLTVQVSNPGGLPAVDAHVRLTLPAGMQHAPSSAIQGAGGTVPRPLTVETLPCTATAEPQRVLCRLGTIDADEQTTVRVPVVVRDGGSYDVMAEVWAEGLEVRRLALPPTRVGSFGPELTTRAADAELAANPGLGTVPFSVRNTGDQPTGDGWAVRLRVPAGLVPHSVTGGLDCEPSAGGAGVWFCSGAVLQPGEAVDAAVSVVVDGSTEAGAYTVDVEPVAADDGPTIAAASSVGVPEGWAGVLAGVGGVQASCRATGGVGVADAVVSGTYTNTTGWTVTVALAAAGSTATERPVLVPGARATLTVPDGLRVPAGRATWTVSTVVAGETYSRVVASGAHGAAECYDPRWEVETTAEAVNVEGRVSVRGTIVNRGDEPMQAGMSALGREADRVRLGAGESSTFTVPTGSTATDAGRVTFDLYRWVLDVDGDEPVVGVVPATAPTATYPAAAIAPAVGKVVPAGACRFDPAAEVSTRTFTVPLDNSASTLPVVFRVELGDRVEQLRLGGGESARFEVEVPWGTDEAVVSADGRSLVTVDVGFAGCATAPASPDVDVTAAAQCEDGDARLVVDVREQDGHDWRATLLRDGDEVAARDLAADGAVRFVVDADGARLAAGEVTVSLTRSVEGTSTTVRRTVEHGGTRCVVIAPSAFLDEGSLETESSGDGTTSWREVGVVLDNTGSTVEVDFRVEGPGGDTEVTVPARATRTTEVQRVDGRQGGRWTVSTETWSTTLDVAAFTGAEAGWCAEPIGWGQRYATGEVRSWNGVDYRYRGVSGDEGDPPGQVGRSERNGRAPGGTDGRFDRSERTETWAGGWSRWEQVGDCEER
ncbi:sigma-70 family RNA polymerase sigma factor [Isoptericola sp. b515]|uniref:sigma-70 family RNA polymerase sigma factor n=1 Tax=Isoptericola sp. b515 TaxID=3064652 RepID=UPI0027127407|nr:sigma-70 family RNA polymerase sigma factor [Isoptericola sp. b515]MDO8149720.1 sigma-70 family RNA polymerase sigma factor [Isoptericola sp. b515]